MEILYLNSKDIEEINLTNDYKCGGRQLKSTGGRKNLH